MIIEIPPTHAAWRAHWTEEDDAEFREIINNQRRARQTLKDADPGSASYWEAAKLDNKMAIACNDLKWRLCRKVYRNDVRRSEYQWMRKELKSHRATLEDKRDDIEKMALRVQNRNSLLGFMKMEGVTPMIHSLEIVDALVTMAEKADPKGLEALAQNMKVAYGTATTAGGTELVWSPLEGDWRMQYELRPTHILPFCISSTTFVYLFKHMQGKREINSADNGLFLPPPVEEALYNHHITFIPVPVKEQHTDTDMEIDGLDGSRPGDAMEYRLIVIDKAQVWNTLATRVTPFSDMHERRLRFLKSCRPLDQYVYVHYLMSVLTLARKLRVVANKNPGKTQDLMAVPELLKMWPSEKTQFGKNINGLFQSALNGVRQKLQTSNSGGQSGQGEIGTNPPVSMSHHTDSGFHMQMNWFATMHRGGEDHD